MSTHGCWKYFGGKQAGTSKVSLAGETVNHQSVCQFLVLFVMKGVVQDATTAC